MHNTARLVVLLAIACGIAACASAPKYAPPPGLTTETAATIVGSKQENPNPFVDDVRTYIVAVDGVLTHGGPRGWDTPVLVAPGERGIRLGVSTGAAFGFVEVRLNFERGKSYTLRSTKPDNLHAAAWIEDTETRAQRTDQLPVRLAIGRPLVAPIIPLAR